MYDNKPKYNGTVSHDSNDYISIETVGPLKRVIRAAYDKPNQLDTIVYSKPDRGYTSPHSNNEYWMDDAGIQKVDALRWKRLNQGFDNAKNAELDALMDEAGFEQIPVEQSKKSWWLGAQTHQTGGKVQKAEGGTKTSLFTNTLKRVPPRIQSNKPLNPSNSWRFIVENFDKEHPDSSIVAPRIMGGEHIY